MYEKREQTVQTRLVPRKDRRYMIFFCVHLEPRKRIRKMTARTTQSINMAIHTPITPIFRP